MFNNILNNRPLMILIGVALVAAALIAYFVMGGGTPSSVGAGADVSKNVDAITATGGSTVKKLEATIKGNTGAISQ